jgi:hypothetical protein
VPECIYLEFPAEEVGWVLAWVIDVRLHNKCILDHGCGANPSAGREKCIVWGAEEQNNCIFQLDHSGKKTGDELLSVVLSRSNS